MAAGRQIKGLNKTGRFTMREIRDAVRYAGGSSRHRVPRQEGPVPARGRDGVGLMSSKPSRGAHGHGRPK